MKRAVERKRQSRLQLPLPTVEGGPGGGSTTCSYIIRAGESRHRTSIRNLSRRGNRDSRVGRGRFECPGADGVCGQAKVLWWVGGKVVRCGEGLDRRDVCLWVEEPRVVKKEKEEKKVKRYSVANVDTVLYGTVLYGTARYWTNGGGDVGVGEKQKAESMYRTRDTFPYAIANLKTS